MSDDSVMVTVKLSGTVQGKVIETTSRLHLWRTSQGWKIFDERRNAWSLVGAYRGDWQQSQVHMTPLEFIALTKGISDKALEQGSPTRSR
jgi:hypothetical protein